MKKNYENIPQAVQEYGRKLIGNDEPSHIVDNYRQMVENIRAFCDDILEVHGKIAKMKEVEERRRRVLKAFDHTLEMR
jgi:hypothetical protein